VTNLGDEYTPYELRVGRIFDRLESRIRSIIMTSAEQAAEGVVTQLGKAKGEIDGVITELEGQAVSAETIGRLQGISQALDDVVPDAPVEPAPEPEVPVEEAPAEPAPEA
jgi:hypothetical protein